MLICNLCISLRVSMTLDTISVDDFDSEDLRAAASAKLSADYSARAA